MNKKVFVATIDWIKTTKIGIIIVPLNNPIYSPQISVEGEYVVNGSTWTVFCYNCEMMGLYRTKSLIKYLNQDSAPDNLKIGTSFSLHEGGKVVAFGKIIDISKIDFLIQ